MFHSHFRPIGLPTKQRMQTAIRRWVSALHGRMSAWTQAWPRWWKTYGFYVELSLAIAIIGVSGWWLRAARQPVTATRQTAWGTSIAAVSPIAPIDPASVRERALPLVGTIQTPHALVWNATLRQYECHEGIDIVAAAGSPVCAVETGYVSAIYTDALYGLTLTLRHSDGSTSQYASLDTVTVAMHEFVPCGAPVGSIGTSALCERALGDHLHFARYDASGLLDVSDLEYVHGG